MKKIALFAIASALPALAIGQNPQQPAQPNPGIPVGPEQVNSKACAALGRQGRFKDSACRFGYSFAAPDGTPDGFVSEIEFETLISLVGLKLKPGGVADWIFSEKPIARKAGAAFLRRPQPKLKVENPADYATVAPHYCVQLGGQVVKPFKPGDWNDPQKRPVPEKFELTMSLPKNSTLIHLPLWCVFDDRSAIEVGTLYRGDVYLENQLLRAELRRLTWAPPAAPAPAPAPAP